MKADLQHPLPLSFPNDVTLNVVSIIAVEVLIFASREELEGLRKEELQAEDELKALFFTCEEKAKEIGSMEKEIEKIKESLVAFEEREQDLLRERVEIWPTLQEAGKVNT